jgi:hypothetical protein
MAVLKAKYANAAALTITLASLATSATRVVGRESTAIDNSTNLYLDALVSGKITTGTTPTAGQIDIWVYACHDETPTYMDVLDGTDSDETFTDELSRNSAMRLAHVIATDTTSNQTYWIAPFSVRELYRGVMPRFWGVFVSHSCVAALHATGGNHEIKYIGYQEESV